MCCQIRSGQNCLDEGRVSVGQSACGCPGDGRIASQRFRIVLMRGHPLAGALSTPRIGDENRNQCGLGTVLGTQPLRLGDCFLLHRSVRITRRHDALH